MQTVFLVGGFAASDWLFMELQEYLQPLGISFSRPDGHLCVVFASSCPFQQLACTSGTRLSLTELFRSTLITLFLFEWLDLLTA
jgi:hypothetical protein